LIVYFVMKLINKIPSKNVYSYIVLAQKNN
jgi:hypothetical protein